MKNVKRGSVSFTITRPQSNIEGDYISLAIEDDVSWIRFVKLKISLENFTRALTGLAAQQAEAEFFGLEYVGKKQIQENRTILCPLATHKKREEMEKWLEENAQEEGWFLRSYLGSQNSTYSDPKGEGTFLRYSVYKYVDVEE